MTKKVLAVLLAVLMVAALATGCSGSGSSSTTSTSSTASTASTQSAASSEAPASSGTEAAEFDLSEHRSITILISQNTFIADYEKNSLTKSLEEEFNCDINVDVLPAGDDGNTRLRLIFNGGDTLPDVLDAFLGATDRYQYGSGGSLIPMDDYVDDPVIMPNFNAIESEEDRQQILNTCTAADGHLYGLACFQPEGANMNVYRWNINQKWLDNLGLEVPTDVYELKDRLAAFATQDPNGNGQQDEIPVFANYVDGGNYGQNVILSLIHSFTYVGNNMSSMALSEDGRTVIAPQVSEGWKDALKYLRELHDVGAITENSFIYGTDTSGYKGILNYQGLGTEPAEDGKSVNIVGFFSVGSHTNTFDGYNRDENVNFNEYTMLPLLPSENCDGWNPYAVQNPSITWFVTEDAADPDFCVHVGDVFYSFKYSQFARYGEPAGEGAPEFIEDSEFGDTYRWVGDWTDDPTFCSDWYEQHTQLMKDAGVTNTKTSYTYVVLNGIWGQTTDHYWRNVNPRYASFDQWAYHFGNWTDPEHYQVYPHMQANADISKIMEYYVDAHPQYLIPEINFTDEEQQTISDFQMEYPNKIMEWTMDFMMGAKDIDGDWQAYLDDLDHIGLNTYLPIVQAAYERTPYYAANFA